MWVMLLRMNAGRECLGGLRFLKRNSGLLFFLAPRSMLTEALFVGLGEDGWSAASGVQVPRLRSTWRRSLGDSYTSHKEKLMPSSYRIWRDALRSAIARQVYGPVPERVYVQRPACSQVVLRQDATQATYLVHETRQGRVLSGLRVAPEAVAVVRSLLGK
jgi:hypothetical protein